MSKCNKAKNPCKICLRQVTHKNGLQCQGACKTWMHFECINYTPGKIRDIKAGTIKVLCPCPDCKSSLPREYRTDEAYSCTNSECPANQSPKCINKTCPINIMNPSDETSAGNGCALNKCGQKCKKNSVPHLPNRMQPSPLPPCNANLRHVPDCTSSADISGDYGQRESPMISMSTLEEMCNTVDHLTNQINCLMSKMKESAQERRGCGKQGCDQRGTKSNCPKPCYCPGNPRR